MGKRMKQSREWHANELHYIAHAWPEGKAAFRGDESVFNDYINMQAEFARTDGFDDIAFHMEGFRQFVPQSKR